MATRRSPSEEPRPRLSARGRRRGIDGFVASILDCVVQPVWVVEQAGLIQFANPSALAALGYEDVSDLLGEPGHQTIRHKRPDGTAFPVEECPMLLPRTPAQTVHSRERPRGTLVLNADPLIAGSPSLDSPWQRRC